MKLNSFKYLLFIFVSFLLFACANRGMGPQGGPKDITPPKLSKSSPALDAVNTTQKNIDIVFDEYIIVEKPNENIIISPVQKKQASIKTTGKSIHIELNDSLIKNTTYTIDFGNCIMDNNERNILKNFSFSFSTGSHIDSLSFKGVLLDAYTLNPVSNCIVGIYSAENKDLFTQAPLERIAKTNEKGEFTLKNIQNKEYAIYALIDLNQNYFFDQKGESIAFLDSTITGRLINENDSNTYYKDKQILLLFKEENKSQKLLKSERKEKEQFQLFFQNSINHSVRLKGLNFDEKTTLISRIEKEKNMLNCWLKNEETINIDTLIVEIKYDNIDSLEQVFTQTDTVYLSKNAYDKKQKKEVQAIIKPSHNFPIQNLEIYYYPTFFFQTPLDKIDESKISLFHKKDTIWEKINFTYEKDSANLNVKLIKDFIPGEKYKIDLDSAAFSNIYHQVNHKQIQEFKVKSEDEYANLTVIPTPYDKRLIIQVIDKDENIILEKEATEKEVFFGDIHPGVYYLKMFIDENANGKWDAGSFKEKRQAEKVFYFNKKLHLRANWDLTEEWEYLKTPILEQKPLELKK